MNSTDIKSITDNYYLALKSKDWDKWTSLFSSDAVRHDIDGKNQVGTKELKQFISGIGDLFQSVNISADSTYITDQGTAVRWVANGEGTNGKHIEFSGIDVFKVDDDGKIIEEWAYWEPAPVISKLTS